MMVKLVILFLIKLYPTTKQELYESHSGGLVVDNHGKNAGEFFNNNPILLKTIDSKGKVSLFKKQSDSYGLTFLDNGMGNLGTPSLYWNDGKSWNKRDL